MGVRAVEDPTTKFLWGSGPLDSQGIGAYANQIASAECLLLQETDSHSTRYRRVRTDAHTHTAGLLLYRPLKLLAKIMGQFTDGSGGSWVTSDGSWVTKCDPLSAVHTRGDQQTLSQLERGSNR